MTPPQEDKRHNRHGAIELHFGGDDWAGKFYFLKDYCEVIYLARTPEVSTTKIKEDLGI